MILRCGKVLRGYGLCLRDEGVAYADALAAAGVPVHHTTYPGLIHGFFDMGPWSPACQRAIDETVARFGELLAKASAQR